MRIGSARHLAAGLIVVTCLPLLVGAIRVIAHDAPGPGGDLSLIELRVRDVGGPATPLVGSYQRFGWNQPGPAWLWVLAVPYRLAGSRYAGLALGALAANAAAVAAIGGVAWRRGGRLGVAWAMAVTGLAMAGLGAGWLSDPWEPSVSVLLLGALAMLGWDVIVGGRFTIVAFGLLATLLLQMYTALAPVTVALVAATAAGRWWRARRSEPARDDRTDAARARSLSAPLAVTAGLVVVAWLPALVEEAVHTSGNLWRMYDFFRTPRPTLGLADAVRAVAIELGPAAQWIGNGPRLVSFTSVIDVRGAPFLPLGFVALAVATVAAARRRHPAVGLGALALVATGAVTAGLARLVDPPFTWTVAPTLFVGAFAWLAAGWCAWVAAPEDWRRRAAPVCTGLLAAAVAGLAVANGLAAARADDGPAPLSPTRTVRALARQALPTLRAVDGPVLVSSEVAGRDLLLDQLGPEDLVLALERAGLPTRVARNLDFRYGRRRARPAEAVAAVRLVRAEAPVRTGWSRLATVDPLTPAQRARVLRLDAVLSRRRARYGPDDPRTQEAFLDLLALPRSPALALDWRRR